MKKLLLMIAAVGVLFTACNKETDCGHEFIEHDYAQELVGTWTCVEAENEFAEALVIKSDGSLELTGSVNGEYWEATGTIEVKNNKMIYKLDNGDEWEGRFEIVAGESFAMVLDDELDIRYTYQYCENDLSDEIVGMWVCNDARDNMRIHSFDENGSAVFSGWSEQLGRFSVLEDSRYKVVGDLIFQSFSNAENSSRSIAARLIYAPNGTAHGDIMVFNHFLFDGIESAESWLRVKQHLDLEGQVYDYNAAYVSSAKGKDEEFTMLGHTFNMANIGAGDFDIVFGADLYIIEVNANSITHTFRPDGKDVVVETPITVDGNMVTLDYSAVNPACRKVEMYMFQDKDNTQLHMYMPTDSFVNYFANLWLPELIAEGKLDATDTAAVEKVYTDMEARIESINVSFVFKAIE